MQQHQQEKYDHGLEEGTGDVSLETSKIWIRAYRSTLRFSGR